MAGIARNGEGEVGAGTLYFFLFYFFIILSFIVLLYFWAIKWIGADFQSLFCPGSDSSPRQCGSQGGDGGEVQRVFGNLKIFGDLLSFL